MKLEQQQDLYSNIYALRDAYRRASGHSDIYAAEFNRTDSPSHNYFRLFFYFNQGNLLDNRFQEDGSSVKHVINNTAMNYLINNLEYERAEWLQEFITLLSNINTYSPWYFTEISGLQDALTHQELEGHDFKIDEERKSITIKCLPDAYDTRIGTLLDLYKNIVWSKSLHRSVLPANLRKFDMGLYLFNTPLLNLHKPNLYNTASIAQKSDSHYITNSKLFEFHNCEIDINSNTTALATLNNGEGNQLEYTITIRFDTISEQRYNEFLVRSIGDVVKWDMDYNLTEDTVKQELDEQKSIRPILQQETQERLGNIEYKEPQTDLKDSIYTKHIPNADALMGKLGAAVKDQVTDAAETFIGGIYNNTIGKIGDKAKQIILGNIFHEDIRTPGYLNKLAANAANNIFDNDVKRSNPPENIDGNIFKGWTKVNK